MSTKIPISAYDDPPAAGTYPEFDEEVFQDYQVLGITPEDLLGSEAEQYRRWLGEKCKK